MKFINVTLFCLLLFPSLNVFAAEGSKKSRLFKGHEVMQLSLEAPFKEIYRVRDKTIKHKASLSYLDNGQRKSIPMNLQLRGNFRLDRENCSEPPLRFLFNKEVVRGTPFAKLEKVKFVQPCKRKAHYQELVYREYLAYRLYNEITDDSYRVRLAEVKLVDSQKGSENTVFGFFIEPNKRLAKRLERKQLKAQSIPMNQVDNVAMARLNLYQYMIANTDYSAITAKDGEECCHNVRVFKADADRYITPIPYDFDFSGMVNAPYAVPGISNSIKSVRQRRYRGFCEQNTALRQQAKMFSNKRGQMNLLVESLPGLNESSRKKTLAYLEKFFKTVGDAKLVEKKLVRYCR